MAASEARAAWQRTANRYFVQEDAKRAPKLACCPSSKLQSEPSYGDAENVTNHPVTFMPLNWNPTNSNLPPDTRWWLQLQPNFPHQKDFMHEQKSSLTELEGMRNENEMDTSKQREGPLSSEDDHIDPGKISCSLLEPRWGSSVSCPKQYSEARVQELRAAKNNTKPLLQQKADMNEWIGNEKGCKDEELMDWEHVDLLISNQPKKTCLDMEAPWIWGDESEPWWRTADKNELACLLAQKSLNHIENCDLPRPQTMLVQTSQFACLSGFNRNTILASPLDQKMRSGLCNPIEHEQCSPAHVSMDGKNCPPSEMQHSYVDSEKSFSGTHSSNATIVDQSESVHASESDRNKAQLLEALRHSQTRAREAEKAAQQAYNEKEHIIKLFFKQASYLFAYKQWLQLLQLESLLLQLKSKENEISMFFPVLPWTPLKASQMRKGMDKMKRKMGRRKGGIGNHAIAFAVGLSLVGAGLLLGWTLGWLLSSL